MRANSLAAVAGMTLGICLAQAQPNVGLLAYYPFTGDANDASGHGLNAIVAGAALTADRFGQTNAAYAFNGRGAHLQINDPSHLLNFDARSNTYTLTLWVKLDELSRRQDFIIDRASLANPPTSYDISFKPSIGFVANCWDGTVNIDVSSTTYPVAERGYQVVMAVNTGDIRLYVNGQRENGPPTEPGTPNTMPPGTAARSTMRPPERSANSSASSTATIWRVRWMTSAFTTARCRTRKWPSFMRWKLRRRRPTIVSRRRRGWSVGGQRRAAPMTAWASTPGLCRAPHSFPARLDWLSTATAAARRSRCRTVTVSY